MVRTDYGRLPHPVLCIGYYPEPPTVLSDCQISRGWLPETYRYRNWNNGLLRGTLSCPPGVCREDSAVLLYGNAGIFLTNSEATTFDDFNRGFPHGVDWRNIRGMAITPQSDLFAASQFRLYRYNRQSGWQAVTLPLQEEERLSDITTRGDSLIIVGRSHLYYATRPYQHFHQLTLKAPEGYDGKVSLFRTVWLLHSGELFGFFGKLLMDVLAAILILLSVSGIAYWLLPKYIRRMKQAGRQRKNKHFSPENILVVARQDRQKDHRADTLHRDDRMESASAGASGTSVRESACHSFYPARLFQRMERQVTDASLRQTARRLAAFYFRWVLLTGIASGYSGENPKSSSRQRHGLKCITA